MAKAATKSGTKILPRKPVEVIPPATGAGRRTDGSPFAHRAEGYERSEAPEFEQIKARARRFSNSCKISCMAGYP